MEDEQKDALDEARLREVLSENTIHNELEIDEKQSSEGALRLSLVLQQAGITKERLKKSPKLSQVCFILISHIFGFLASIAQPPTSRSCSCLPSRPQPSRNDAKKRAIFIYIFTFFSSFSLLCTSPSLACTP